MKNILSYIKDILLAIWQLPQVIVGLLALLHYEPTHKIQSTDCVIYYSSHKKGCTAYGPIVISNACIWREDSTAALKKRSIREAKLQVEKSKKYGPVYYLAVLFEK